MPLVAREQGVEERSGPVLPAFGGVRSDLCQGGVDLLHQRVGIRLLVFEIGRQVSVQAGVIPFHAIPGESAPAIHQMATEPGGQIPIQSGHHGGSRWGQDRVWQMPIGVEGITSHGLGDANQNRRRKIMLIKHRI